MTAARDVSLASRNDDANAGQPFRVERLDPFGVRLIGLRLEALAAAETKIIGSLLADHGVVIAPGQFLDDAGLTQFLKTLGPLTFTEGEPAVDGFPHLNVVSNVGRDRPPRSVFHTDTSYVARPPAYTALRAVAVPGEGGETLFADQYAAYAALPPGIRNALEDMEVLHRVTGLASETLSETEAWHRLCRRHPEAGRTALFLSTPDRCVAIRGVDRADPRILSILYRRSIRKAGLLSHRWRRGDVVIWDNRCTLHRGDHSRTRGDRVLHRGMVADRGLSSLTN